MASPATFSQQSLDARTDVVVPSEVANVAALLDAPTTSKNSVAPPFCVNWRRNCTAQHCTDLLTKHFLYEVRTTKTRTSVLSQWSLSTAGVERILGCITCPPGNSTCIGGRSGWNLRTFTAERRKDLRSGQRSAWRLGGRIAMIYCLAYTTKSSIRFQRGQGTSTRNCASTLLFRKLQPECIPLHSTASAQSGSYSDAIVRQYLARCGRRCHTEV